VFNCFFEAAWELQTGFLKPHGRYRWLFQSLLRSVHRFPGGFKKSICSSHVTLDLLLTLRQKGLRKFVKIPEFLQEVK
jgi:hypothetical protein